MQDALHLSNFEYSDAFTRYLNSKNVEVEYLDQYNKPYTEMQTYTYAVNLYIQRASSVSNWTQPMFQGNISLMKLTNPPSNYTPSDTERMLYYLVRAASGSMRAVGQNISDLYRSETEQHALSVAFQTELTIILSIVSILLVSVVISPVVCRIEERKYTGLKFFLNVEPSHILLLDLQVKEFLDLAFSD